MQVANRQESVAEKMARLPDPYMKIDFLTGKPIVDVKEQMRIEAGEELTKQGISIVNSHTINIGDNQVQGTLFKKSSSKISNWIGTTEKLFLKRFFQINFSREVIQMRVDHHPSSKERLIEFKEVVQVKYAILDPIKDREVPHKFKFILYIKSRLFECYVRTDSERDLWIQAICRIIDSSSGKRLKWNDPQLTFEKVKKAREQANVRQKNLDPYKIAHRSAKMDFNYSGVQGTLYKKIQNVKIYHSSQWHTKYFIVNF